MFFQYILNIYKIYMFFQYILNIYVFFQYIQNIYVFSIYPKYILIYIENRPSKRYTEGAQYIKYNILLYVFFHIFTKIFFISHIFIHLLYPLTNFLYTFSTFIIILYNILSLCNNTTNFDIYRYNTPPHKYRNLLLYTN